MSQYNLDRIFQPRRLAVVGASESAGSVGDALMKNLIKGGFQGKLLPVNPKYHHVLGISAVGSVSALETGVDLAVIATPIHTVDVNFGPVIVFGMGGIFTEVLKDRALGLPPMNRLLARRMMQETKVWTLLQGYRNRPPADMERLEEMIIRLSQLLIDFPQIAELDMNPVLIKDGNPVAVDARILVSKASLPSPLHLVISAYPEEDETHLVTQEGASLFIRPVRPEDAPLFQNFFKVLSPSTIYNRFFTHVRVWGTVLSENQSMLALGKRLGFQTNKNPGDQKEFDLVISLESFGESLKK